MEDRLTVFPGMVPRPKAGVLLPLWLSPFPHQNQHSQHPGEVRSQFGDSQDGLPQGRCSVSGDRELQLLEEFTQKPNSQLKCNQSNGGVDKETLKVISDWNSVIITKSFLRCKVQLSFSCCFIFLLPYRL